MEVTPAERGMQVVAFDGATPFYVLSDSAAAAPATEWYRNFDLAAERARGLPDRTDHFFAGEFRATIAPGESLTIVASTAADAVAHRGGCICEAPERSRARCSTDSSLRTRDCRGLSGSGDPATCSRGGPVHCGAPARRRGLMQEQFWPGIPGSAIGAATR